MAYSLTLPARNKARRARMALDGAEPDFTVPQLIAWAGSNLSKSELSELCDSLGKLAAEAEDEEPDDRAAFNRERSRRAEAALNESLSGAQDSRHRVVVSSSKAESEFRKMFPQAGEVLRA
jgi:hypothetical protein